MQAACVTINLPPGPGTLEEHKVSGTGKDKVLLMDISGVISSDNKDGFYTITGNAGDRQGGIGARGKG